MWIVGLAHDVVLAELGQALDGVVVLDDAAVDVVAERLPDVERVEVGLITRVAHELCSALHPVPLLVEHLLGALQEVGHPTAFALRQGDLEVRVALEQPAEEPGQHGSRGARGAPGEVGHERCVLQILGSCDDEPTCMLADHSELVGRSHHRLPVVVGVVNGGQPQRFRVLGEGKGRDAPGRHAFHLLGCQRRVPHRNEHQRDVAARRGAAPLLDEPVVVVLQALEAELPVAGIHEQLPAESGDGRKAQRCKHAGAVHVLDARRGVVTPWSHLGVGQRFRAELLFGFADDRAQPGIRVPLTVVDPHVHAVVVGFHVRRAVPVLGSDAIDPEIRRFEDMVVDRDQPVQIEVRCCFRRFRFGCR